MLVLKNKKIIYTYEEVCSKLDLNKEEISHLKCNEDSELIVTMRTVQD